MVNPKIMCRKHLLGEHVEIHMFASGLKRQINMSGYLNNNLLEPKSLKSRHLCLVKEIKNRGYKHNSDLKMDFDISYLNELKNKKIDVKKSEKELISRCNECKKMRLELKN